MSKHEVAFTAAAAVGLGCVAASMLGVWVLLGDPLAVANGVSHHDLGTFFRAGVDLARHAAAGLLGAN